MAGARIELGCARYKRLRDGSLLSAGTAHVVLICIVAVSIVLMLVRPRDIPEVWWVGGGAVLLVALRIVSLPLAGKAVAEGLDVYLFLIGMMLLSELARSHGVFDWVSSSAVRGSKGSCLRLFALIYGIGVVVTIAMSNDATAVVLTPAVLSAVRKAKVPPRPYLFACAMIANAASFVLPISNPANLVVFHGDMPGLGKWLLAFLLPSVLSIAVTFVALRVVFRDELRGSIESEADEAPLSRQGRFVLGGLALVVVILVVASAYKVNLGLPTCLAALGIVAAVSIESRQNPVKLASGISWSTLLLVAGLFVMVDAVEGVGTLALAEHALLWTGRLPGTVAALVVSFAVGVGNNVVNNLPLGLIAGATVQGAHVHGLISEAVLVGVDLGPNLSVTGSLATILWLLALRKEGLDVSAWDFLKVGVVAMPLAMVASVAGLVAMHALQR